LLKLYESIYCEKNEEDRYISLPNKFDNWEKYFLQKVKINIAINLKWVDFMTFIFLNAFRQ